MSDRPTSPTLLPIPVPPAAHLWTLEGPHELDRKTFDRLDSLLLPDERVERDRHRLRRSREELLVSRAFLRVVLSRYSAVPPRDWRFVRNERGRPEVAGPAGAPALSFNLSHTRGLVAAIVTGGGEVGVDIEPLDRRESFERIAERLFDPAEVRALRSLPEPDRPLRFLELWTLKEAILKARGVGLTVPFPRIDFVGGEPRSARWHLALERPTEGHLLARAIGRRSGDTPPEIESFALSLQEILSEATRSSDDR